MERIEWLTIGRTRGASGPGGRIGRASLTSAVLVGAVILVLAASAAMTTGPHGPAGPGGPAVTGGRTGTKGPAGEVTATDTPSPTGGIGAPPPCTYRDDITAHAAYADWAETILDTALRLPQDYVPPDLVAIDDPGGSHGQVRAFVRGPLLRLLDAARRHGETITVSSAYRSYADQVDIFDGLAASHGYDFALLSAARPGHSEHQLGTAVDFDGAENWLSGNAWRFGFVRSYPPDRSPEKTCYKFEPWHFRYVGPDRAKAINASGLSLREWLWATVGG